MRASWRGDAAMDSHGVTVTVNRRDWTLLFVLCARLCDCVLCMTQHEYYFSTNKQAKVRLQHYAMFVFSGYSCP